MRRRAFTLGLCLLTCSGCAPFYRSPVKPPPGIYPAHGYNNTSAPVDVRFGPTRIGSKEGRAEAHSVLALPLLGPLVAWGDASVQEAARDGRITRVDQIDCQVYNILGFYSEYVTIVHGE